jgi:hypothetical protein
VSPDSHAYEEKYAWSPLAAWTLAILLAAGLLYGLNGGISVWLRIGEGCFLGFLVVSLTVRIWSGRTAFRADASGVTIGTRRPALVCAWSDVEEIRLREQFGMQYIWVHCRPGTIPVRRRRPPRPAARRLVQFLYPGSPAAASAAAPPGSLAVLWAFGWVLRPDMLTAAAAHYAPALPVTVAAGLPAAAGDQRGGSLRTWLTGPQWALVRRVLCLAGIGISVMIIAEGAKPGPWCLKVNGVRPYRIFRSSRSSW